MLPLQWIKQETQRLLKKEGSWERFLEDKEVKGMVLLARQAGLSEKEIQKHLRASFRSACIKEVLGMVLDNVLPDRN